MRSSILTFITLALSGSVTAHPGEDHAAEAASIKAVLDTFSKSDLSHCAEKLKASGHTDRQIARRNELARSLRLSEGLDKRALSDINKSHHVDEHYTLTTPSEVLFSSNNSVVLSPEVTEGPYYVAGEYVRQDLTDGQEGVPLYIQTQVIDIETCEPVNDIYLEIWSCNATGVYSGVLNPENGNPDDLSNINATFLRGLQPTDADGTSMFKIIFPGHYVGRTAHVHTFAHINATMFPNGTIMNSVASHVGQMYFDQDLITEVESVSPYKENTQELTTNAVDRFLPGSSETSDPWMEYVYLGEGVQDGLLAWLSFGVNQSFVREVNVASVLYETGGVEV